MGIDVRLRPLGIDDIPMWNRLLALIEDVDRTGEHVNEPDLAEEMANPAITLGKDIIGAYAGEDLVGYFAVYPHAAAGQLKLHLNGAVRPDRRGEGIGTVLAAAMRRRAEELHAAEQPTVPALLTTSGLTGDAAQAELMERIGMTAERWSLTMRIDLGREPAGARPLPHGLELRRYDDEVDAAMREAHNVVFRDHPNFTPWSQRMWKQWVSGSRNFRPRLSFVVLDPARPGEVAAYLQTNEYDACFERTGRREAYVGKVGTRREYRRRGLAGLLLHHALREYRAAGYDEASLDVDAENPTGALGIYRRAGFEVESRRTVYTARLEPLRAAGVTGG